MSSEMPRPVPPPMRRPWQLTTPGIPFYRDVRVLRVTAQVVFLTLFGFAVVGLTSSLLSNLAASNVPLDFGAYRRPFNVAIPEGLSVIESWTWTRDAGAIQTGAWVTWGVLLLAAGMVGVQGYRAQKRVPPAAAGLALLLLALLVVYPPGSIAAWLVTVFSDYLAPSTISRAFVTGIGNTLTVTFVSLVACTLLGIFIGVGLLSKNLLVRALAGGYVELFRNTPLTVQLIFIYRTLTLLLPPPRQSIFAPESIGPLTLPGNLYAVNARGFYFVRLDASDTGWIFLGVLALTAGSALVARWWRARRQERTGKPAHTGRIVTGIVLVGILLAFALSGTPFVPDYPVLQGPNIRGGTQLSMGFVALALGLTLYTAAFIADIVRAGIQAVSYGQIEAGRSQGFSEGQILNLIILPQALRLILPPLGNQWVNLGKNSSLAVVVNYVDTYRIAQLANNESGQAVPFFVGLMVIYLSISLLLSLLANAINRLTRIRSR